MATSPKDKTSLTSSRQPPSVGSRNVLNKTKQPSPVPSSLGVASKSESHDITYGRHHPGGSTRSPKKKPREDTVVVINTEEFGLRKKRKVPDHHVPKPESTQLGKGEETIIDVSEFTGGDSGQGPKPKVRKQDLLIIEIDDDESASQQIKENAITPGKTDDEGWKQPSPTIHDKAVGAFNISGCMEEQRHGPKATHGSRAIEKMVTPSPGTIKKRRPEDTISEEEPMFASKEKRRRQDLQPDGRGKTSAQTLVDTGFEGFLKNAPAAKRHPGFDNKLNKNVRRLQLPAHLEEEVSRALGPGPEDEVLSAAFKLRITRADMRTLRSHNWLNDDIINFYLNLLVERNTNQGYPSLHAFNTFFYPKLTSAGYPAVKRWTDRVNLFQKEILLIPIHQQVHWSLAVIDLRRKSVTYLDSMGKDGTEICQVLFKYLQEESKTRKNMELNPLEWSLYSMGPEEIPQQQNWNDCGIFTCKFADCISRDQPITFTQEQMPLFRKEMVWEILHQQLMGQ